MVNISGPKFVVHTWTARSPSFGATLGSGPMGPVGILLGASSHNLGLWFQATLAYSGFLFWSTRLCS